jgi:transcription antitermination factor NusG
MYTASLVVDIQPSSVTAGHEVLPADRPSGVRWYALRTAPSAEKRVAERLRRNGIEEFLPTWVETSRWSDRQKQVTRPLFAGYLFALFDRANATTILQTAGVLQILGTDELSAIPDDEIAALRAVVDSPHAIERCPYVAGATVTVERGPFAGIKGIVTRTRGSALLTIPITILGRAVSVEIDAADVKAEKP